MARRQDTGQKLTTEASDAVDEIAECKEELLFELSKAGMNAQKELRETGSREQSRLKEYRESFRNFIVMIGVLIAIVTAVLGVGSVSLQKLQSSIRERLEALEAAVARNEELNRGTRARLDAVRIDEMERDYEEKVARIDEMGVEIAQLRTDLLAHRRRMRDIAQMAMSREEWSRNPLQEPLLQKVQRFQGVLESVGIDFSGTTVSFKVFPRFNSVFYNGQHFALGQEKLGNEDEILYEYVLYFLLKNDTEESPEEGADGIIAGLARYLVCSYKKSPAFGGIGADAKPQDLSARRQFAPMSNALDPFDDGRSWAAFFWKMREQLGESATDRTVVGAWKKTGVTRGESNARSVFVRELLHDLKRYGNSELSEKVHAVLLERGLQCPQRNRE